MSFASPRAEFAPAPWVRQAEGHKDFLQPGTRGEAKRVCALYPTGQMSRDQGHCCKWHEVLFLGYFREGMDVQKTLVEHLLPYRRFPVIGSGIDFTAAESDVELPSRVTDNELGLIHPHEIRKHPAGVIDRVADCLGSDADALGGPQIF